MKFFRGNDIVFWRWRLFFLSFFLQNKIYKFAARCLFFSLSAVKVIKNATCSIYKSIKH